MALYSPTEMGKVSAVDLFGML